MDKCGSSKSKIRLNIGGTIFQCYEETLRRFPESLLARITQTMEAYDNEHSEFFFDRNPSVFSYLLDACRKGSIHLPKDMCGLAFKDELEFWELSPSHVSPCCWESLYKCDEDMSTMQTLIRNIKEDTNACILQQEQMSVKLKLWLLLDEPSSSTYALIWSSIISLLIVASTVISGLQSLQTMTVNYTGDERTVVMNFGDMLGWDNATVEAVLAMKPHPLLVKTDVIIHAILTLELILCFTVCPKKKSYAASVTVIVVFIGYLSFWINVVMYMYFTRLTSIHQLRAYTVLGYLSVLKLGRLLYLTKHLAAFSIMSITFRTSFQELKVLVFLLGILVSFFGVVMYIVEVFDRSQMNNIFVAMYWALITLTTVGYGDYTPETTIGHVVAGTCALCGIIVLALPIGILASSFYKFYNYHTYARKHFQICGKQLQENLAILNSSTTTSS